MSAHAMVLVLATTSKVPFYIAGGLLAVWAVLVSAIGISRPDFPGSRGARAVTMAISAVLVVAAMATAVLTSTFEHTESAKAQTPKPAPAPSGGGTATTGGTTSGGGGGSTVQIAADPTGNLRYQEKTVAAKAGSVVIAFTNKSPVPHNVTVVQGGGAPLGATQTISNSRAQLKLTLKPGSYTFFCSVDGHRAAGMQGTLVVK